MLEITSEFRKSRAALAQHLLCSENTGLEHSLGKTAEVSNLAYFVYQSHKFAKPLLEAVDILHTTADGGTKQSFEKTKKKAHKAVH